jgi:hypothetical protein
VGRFDILDNGLTVAEDELESLRCKIDDGLWWLEEIFPSYQERIENEDDRADCS